MRTKVLLTIGLIVLFFFGEIAITFSFKQDDNRVDAKPDIIPLSFKVADYNAVEPSLKIIDSIMSDFIERFGIIGASVSIAKEGRLVYSKGFGMADKEMNSPAGPENLFRIASVSKLITAVAIMKLVEDEKLSLNQKVFGKGGILNDSIYLNYEDVRYENITITHLLDHTAGWNGKKSDPVFNSLYVARLMKIKPPATMPAIIQYTMSKPLDFEPGKTYSYSNLGYCILGEIIEKLTGMEYEDYVQFAILHPLGIYDMHIGRSFYDQRYLNEVRYYDFERDMLVYSYNGSMDLVPAEYGGNPIELIGAAGGWVASAPELAKLMVAIDGYDSRPDILSKATIDFMTNAKYHTENAIGWRATDGYGTWWRTGTFSGTTALIMRHQNGINWVVLLNTTTDKRKQIHQELSRTMFSVIHNVRHWPEYDLFNFDPDNEHLFAKQ